MTKKELLIVCVVTCILSFGLITTLFKYTGVFDRQLPSREAAAKERGMTVEEYDEWCDSCQRYMERRSLANEDSAQ